MLGLACRVRTEAYAETMTIRDLVVSSAQI